MNEKADHGARKRQRAAGLSLLAVALLQACASHGIHGEVGACEDKSSAACLAEREKFQIVVYPGMVPDSLLAAGCRALGDLDFQLDSRDDSSGTAAGTWLSDYAGRDTQLQAELLKTLRRYSPRRIHAAVTVTALPSQSTQVLLQLTAIDNSDAAISIDSVVPYQIFFRKLGNELNTPVHGLR